MNDTILLEFRKEYPELIDEHITTVPDAIKELCE